MINSSLRFFEEIDNLVINSGKMLHLDIGCGKNKKEGFLGIDRFKGENIDLCLDLNSENFPFEDNSVSGIRLIHTLEHISNPIRFWNELYRICRNDAILYCVVPHPMSSYYYGDFTHKTFYNERSFSKYLSGNFIDLYSDYGLKCKFKCLDQFVFGKDFEHLSIHAILKADKE